MSLFPFLQVFKKERIQKKYRAGRAGGACSGAVSCWSRGGCEEACGSKSSFGCAAEGRIQPEDEQLGNGVQSLPGAPKSLGAVQLLSHQMATPTVLLAFLNCR